MVPRRISRRDVLRLSAFSLVGLAGCSTRAGDDTASPSPTVANPTYSHIVTAPDVSKVRNPEGDPAVRSSAHTPEKDVLEASSRWGEEMWLVASTDERDGLEFAPKTTGVDDARAFAAGLDLSETTLLVHQYYVRACETRRLERLRWGRTTGGDAVGADIQLDYEPADRPGECEAGTTEGDAEPADGSEPSHDSEATFVRLNDTFDLVVSMGYQV